MALIGGSRLGPYEIVAAVGAGGMGEVYRARDARLHRDVALKVLPDSFAADPERRARFEREAQAIAALSHPNVIAVFDIGTHDDRIYVVTELLEGETLRQRLGTGHPLPMRKAIDIAAQVARGLAAAHDKHLIHRDLKPENIFLVDDGRAKILDFGLARQMPSPSGASETLAAATGEGIVMGTVGYMAPEQVRGQPIDARADVFAFGCVLFEMLTGQRAFRRDTAAETMTAILRDDPPELTQLRAELAPSLDRIVRHCLEKSPAERFETARDLAFALEALSGPDAPSGGVSSRAAATTSAAAPSRWPQALVATVVVLIALAGWYFATRSRSSESITAPPASVIAIGTATQFTSDDGLEIDPAISPDGRTVAYAAGTARHRRIYIRPVIGGRTIPLSDGKSAIEFQPRWSPDGSQILYLTPDGAFVASAYGGAASAIAVRADTAPGSAITAAAWSPDGKQILLARDKALSVMTRDDRSERPLNRATDGLYSCDWSPRGDLVACASGNQLSVAPGPTFANVAPSSIVVARSAGGSLVEIAGPTGLNQNPVWSADGRQLYFVSNRQGTRDIYVIDIAPGGAAAGEARRVTTGLGAQAFAFSAGRDRLAYVTYTSRANIWSLPIPASGTVDTSSARAITSGNQSIEAMRVSQDKQWLLFDSTLHVNSELFRVPIGGGTQTRLTEDPADDFAPDLSPDGREVAYHSWRTGTRDVYLMPVGGGTPQPLTATPAQESYPFWSPDGQAIAFVDQRLDRPWFGDAFLIRRDAGGRWSPPQPLRAGISLIGGWLPDGHALAFGRGSALEVIPTDGGSPRVVYAPAPGSADPPVEGVAVSDDGRTLYFKSHDSEGRASIWRVPVEGGRPQLLVRFTDVRESSRFDFAAGAGRFFFTLEDRQSDIWIAEIKK